jgi:tRNA dimethylallyltransferase
MDFMGEQEPMKKLPPILAIVGATASGKTDMALKRAQTEEGELISVDSRQIYQHLSVGTAKPCGKWSVIRGKPTYHVPLTPDSAVTIPYHLVDIWDPAKAFSAADFIRLAAEKIQEIQARGKKPILVGGTGLYFNALYKGLAPLPTASEAIRRRLNEEAEKKGRAHLHDRLARIDPEAAAKIPANNIQRLVRALEVHELTGKPISFWHKEHVPPADFDIDFVGIEIPRVELVKRIEKRCHEMMAHGMIEETQALLSKGYKKTAPALTGLGYPRIISFLEGSISKEECLSLLIQDTRQYAKRQMTWFRRQLPVQWNA